MINGQTSPERQAALDRFSAAVVMPGDPVRGKQVFVEATCSLCHQLEDVGENVGPDLKTLVDRSPQNLLVAIIDPNRAVKERFVEYRIVTADGLVHSAVLLDQSGNSLTIANGKGKKITLLRRDVEELIPTTRSLMGEGLEMPLRLQRMADLLAFLAKAGPPRKRLPGNDPTTVLSDQDNTVALAARRAEIYGPQISFDPRIDAITSWTDAEAYVVWTLQLQQLAEVDVWIEWACADNAAGRPFLIESGAQTIAGKVPATGTWDDYRWQKIGQLTLDAGARRIGFRSDGAIDGPLVRLRTIKLTPPGTPPAAAPASAAPKPAHPQAAVPDADGTIRLVAAKGQGVGPNIKYQPEFRSFGWFRDADQAQWELRTPRAGRYDAWLIWSVDDANAGKAWQLVIGGRQLIGVAGRTGSWETYKRARIGRIELPAGSQKAVFRAGAPFDGYLLDLRGIELAPVAPADPETGSAARP